jgi:hypothetical protein
LSDILKVYKENIFPEKYCDNQNIGPFKYRFRLSIFQINHSIDDIDYRTALIARVVGPLVGNFSYGKLYFWSIIVWAIVFLGKCFSGQMSSGQMSLWANVVWANVSGQMSLGKRRMGKCHGTVQKCQIPAAVGTNLSLHLQFKTKNASFSD